MNLILKKNIKDFQNNQLYGEFIIFYKNKEIIEKFKILIKNSEIHFEILMKANLSGNKNLLEITKRIFSDFEAFF